MSRIPKFRVWNNFVKIFVVDKYYHDEYVSICLGFHSDICAAPSNFTLQQSSELKDRNGREIFEGDIVRCLTVINLNTQIEEWRIGTVEFFEGAFVVRYRFRDNFLPILAVYRSNGLEVIGNVLETPWLLDSDQLELDF